MKTLDSGGGDELELEEQEQVQAGKLKSDPDHLDPLAISKIKPRMLDPSDMTGIRDPTALKEDHPFLCGLSEAYVSTYSLNVGAHFGKNTLEWARKVSFANSYAYVKPHYLTKSRPLTVRVSLGTPLVPPLVSTTLLKSRHDLLVSLVSSHTLGHLRVSRS